MSKKAVRRWRNGQVEVDMPAVRGIHMDHIRVARAFVLAELDVAYMRADEAGGMAEKACIAAEKQRLRDLPQTFNLSMATTPDELHALWPTDLSRP